MKQFIIDFIIILMIISVVMGVHDTSAPSYAKVNNEKEKFEEQVIRQEPIQDTTYKNTVYEVEENNAGKLALASSEFVIHVIEQGMNWMNQWILIHVSRDEF